MTKIDLNSLEEQDVQPPSTKELSLLDSRKNHKKKVIVLLGVVVVLIGVTVNQLELFNSPSDVVVVTIPSPAEESSEPSRDIMDMKFLAGTLLDTKNWAVQPVHSFVKQWNILEFDEKHTIKQLTWFQEFSSGLKNQMVRQKVLSDAGDQQAIRRTNELLVLAGSLGLSIASMEAIDEDEKMQLPLAQKIVKELQPSLAQKIIKEPQLPLAQKIVKELQSPLAQKTAKEPPPPLAQKIAKESPPPLAQKIVKEPQSPLAQKIVKEPPPPLAQKIAKEPPLPLAQISTKEQDSAKLPSAKTLDIFSLAQEVNKVDLEDTIAKYIAAFEGGQTSKIIDLFASDEYSNRKKPLAKIANEIAYIINSSVSRKIDLHATQWVDNSREVIGEGRYTSILNPLGDGIKQQLTAHIRLTLRQVLNQTLITNFVVSKQTIVDISQPNISQQRLAKQDISKKIKRESNAVNAKLAYPSRAELEDLVSRYVKTYQEGDVKGLVALFTKNKSSRSKQVSQKELMEYNYSELFESTAERRISITNLKWSFKDNKAIGKGHLTLKYDDEVDVDIAQKGKILIVAERNQARVGLKNLFHIIDQN